MLHPSAYCLVLSPFLHWLAGLATRPDSYLVRTPFLFPAAVMAVTILHLQYARWATLVYASICMFLVLYFRRNCVVGLEKGGTTFLRKT